MKSNFYFLGLLGENYNDVLPGVLDGFILHNSAWADIICLSNPFEQYGHGKSDSTKNFCLGWIGLW